MENYEPVYKMYNLLYCNKTHRAFTDRVGQVAMFRRTRDTMANTLIDAAMECCGHPLYRGAVGRLFRAIAHLNDGQLEGLAHEHLLNFATEEHVLTLKGDKDAAL